MKSLFLYAALGATALGGVAIAAQTEPTTATATAKPPRGDSDRDGKISKAEYTAQFAKRFTRMDTNGDGKVDATERSAAAEGGKRGGRGMSRLDQDGDGVITRAEFDALTDKRFARMDTNGDGFIDATERQAGMGRHGSGGAGADTSTPPPAPEGN